MKEKVLRKPQIRHEAEPNYSGKFHTFLVNQQGFQVRDLC